MNTAHIQLPGNSVNRRLQQPPLVRPVRGLWQDNPAPNHAPPDTPQPAPLKNTTRTVPNRENTNTTHRKKTHLGKDVQLNLWVRPVVKAELERVAKREGVSVSAAGEALLEKALQTDIHTQHATLLDTVIDKAIAKYLRVYSDRNAGLQARTIQKTEMVFQIVTNLLARIPGMDESHMERILNDADDAARGSIKRMTPKDKKVIADEQAEFEQQKKGGR